MRYVKLVLVTLLILLVGGFLHYTLPQHDIVRIVNTYEERQDISGWTSIFWQAPDNGTATIQSRDVQFIQAVTPEGRTRVYRNEDTGWGWPPYFKFDTANLYTEANDAISTKANPEWVVITHYGWRSEILSTFPNAMAIKPVAGPEVTVVPWVSAIILVFLAIVLLLVWRMLAQFRERAIDPLVEDVEEAWDAVDEKKDNAVERIKGWFRRK